MRPLNADRSLLREPASFSDQLVGLINGTYNTVHIDSFYHLTADGKYITLHSVAPGAVDNEQIGIFINSIPALARTFQAICEIVYPEATIAKDPKAANDFVKEVKDLKPAKKKASAKTQKSVSQ